MCNVHTPATFLPRNATSHPVINVTLCDDQHVPQYHVLNIWDIPCRGILCDILWHYVTLFGLLMSHFVTPIKVQLTWVTSWWKYNICHIVYILIIAVWRCMSYYIAVINVTKCDDRPCNICHTAPNCLEYFLTLRCIASYLDFVLNLYNRRGFSKEKVIIASSRH